MRQVTAAMPGCRTEGGRLPPIIRMFRARRVLDFCAGWGDRLLGALSCHEDLEGYCGMRRRRL